MPAKPLRSGSLTDDEVSLVIALLQTKKYEQQQILGLINTIRTYEKRAHINNGRITEVNYIVEGKKNKLTPNQLERLSKIKAASSSAVEAFLEKCKSLNTYEVLDFDPFSKHALRRLLEVRTENPLVLNVVETDCVECKKSFNAPMKTIAAFANNKGGYFLFGVQDKTWEVVGLADNKFENFDLKSLNTDIRSKLGADLQIQKRIVNLQGKKIGILYVAPAYIKPLIFINGEGEIAQGHIYYRYAGEDRLIAPTDLQKLIEDRIKQLTETVLLKHIGNLLRAGVDNAAVLNVQTGEVLGKAGNFVIDEALLPKLQFIREGELNEKNGATALKLIGDLKTTSVTHHLQKVSITEADLIDAFVKQTPPNNPEAYIHRYKEASKDWLPIYYYAHLHKISNGKLLDILKEAPAAKGKKIANVKSGKLPGNAYRPTNLKKEIDSLKSHTKIKLSKFEDLKPYIHALQCWKFTEHDREYIMKLLNDAYAFYQTGSPAVQGLIRTAVAYVDSVLYRTTE